MKKKIRNLALLGGTFDPPHEGHVYITNFIIKKFNFQKCFWAVNSRNPFKKIDPKFTYNQRISMCKTITKKNKKILTVNIKYISVFQLINKIKKKYSVNKILFIVGSDNLIDLHKWYKFEYIINNVNFIFIERPGYRNLLKKSSFFKKYNKHQIKKNMTIQFFDNKSWIYCKTKGLNISSSILRNGL